MVPYNKGIQTLGGIIGDKFLHQMFVCEIQSTEQGVDNFTLSKYNLK